MNRKNNESIVLYERTCMFETVDVDIKRGRGCLKWPQDCS